MDSRYRVKHVVFQSDESFSFLVDLCTGVPLVDPTAYTMTEFRARNRASATIEQVLRALKVFVLFCDQRQINLGERMQRGQLLELGELDALVQI
jgi:hypothetical protein